MKTPTDKKAMLQSMAFLRSKIYIHHDFTLEGDSLLFQEIPTKHTKKLGDIKRPDRNKKEKQTKARELSQEDVLELMGVNNRGHKRHRGSWRQA